MPTITITIPSLKALGIRFMSEHPFAPIGSLWKMKVLPTKRKWYYAAGNGNKFNTLSGGITVSGTNSVMELHPQKILLYLGSATFGDDLKIITTFFLIDSQVGYFWDRVSKEKDCDTHLSRIFTEILITASP